MNSEYIALKLAQGATVDRKKIKNPEQVIRILEEYQRNAKAVIKQLKETF